MLQIQGLPSLVSFHLTCVMLLIHVTSAHITKQIELLLNQIRPLPKIGYFKLLIGGTSRCCWKIFTEEQYNLTEEAALTILREHNLLVIVQEGDPCHKCGSVMQKKESVTEEGNIVSHNAFTGHRITKKLYPGSKLLRNLLASCFHFSVMIKTCKCICFS